MLKSKLAVAAVLALLAAPALAIECPGLMGDINALLAGSPQLTAAQLAQVREYRKLGEDYHKEDDHEASVAYLELALDILLQR